MKAGNPQALFQHLIVLCKEVSEGNTGIWENYSNLLKRNCIRPWLLNSQNLSG